MSTKKWWTSKTLWANFLMFIGVAMQMVTGNELFDAEVQTAAIVIVNFILRLITKTGLE